MSQLTQSNKHRISTSHISINRQSSTPLTPLWENTAKFSSVKR